jgi:protein lifeguard
LLQDFVLRNYWVTIASWVAALAMIIVLSCSTRARRKYPYNYLFLGLFTIVFSVMAASITARYQAREVGVALAVTAATVFGAFFVAKFTKLDITGAGGFLLAILFGVIVMSIIGIFWRNKCVFSGFPQLQSLHNDPMTCFHRIVHERPPVRHERYTIV